MRVQTSVRVAMGVMVLAFAGGACAQISLSSAVDMALKNDPRVKMANASVLKATAVLDETRDVYIPNVGIKGGYGASDGVPLSVPVVFSIASESLLFNFSQRDNVRAAEAGLKAAKLAQQDAQEQAIEDVIVTYLNLDSAEQRQVAMKEELGFTSRLTSIIQARIDAGQDTRMELLKARRTAAQIRLSSLNTEDEIANLTDHLGRLLGLPGMQIAPVSDSIPTLPELSSFTPDNSDGLSVQSAFAGAVAKQETAFGEARYRYRPQVAFGANYSRITTANTNYKVYYPAFQNLLSYNAISVGLEIQIPIMDFEHQAHARESSAEALRAAAEAQSSRIQFLEGRSKLRHSLAELSARGEVADLDREIAQDQLDTILIQLGSSSSDANTTMLTPKDEQNARLQERQRHVDLLNAQAELRQSKVNLMRQSGMLGEWLKSTLLPAQTLPSTSIRPTKP
jgi:outer membrane protein TolC